METKNRIYYRHFNFSYGLALNMKLQLLGEMDTSCDIFCEVWHGNVERVCLYL